MDLPVNVRISSDTLAYSLGNEIFALDFDARTATVSGEERLIRDADPATIPDEGARHRRKGADNS